MNINGKLTETISSFYSFPKKNHTIIQVQETKTNIKKTSHTSGGKLKGSCREKGHADDESTCILKSTKSKMRNLHWDTSTLSQDFKLWCSCARVLFWITNSTDHKRVYKNPSNSNPPVVIGICDTIQISSTKQSQEIYTFYYRPLLKTWKIVL